jgi:hypothetical protein
VFLIERPQLDIPFINIRFKRAGGVWGGGEVHLDIVHGELVAVNGELGVLTELVDLLVREVCTPPDRRN